MGKIVLRMANIRNASNTIRAARCDVNRSLSQVCRSKQTIDYRIRSKNNIDARLNHIIYSLSQVSDKLAKIDSTVNHGIDSYQNADYQAMIRAQKMIDAWKIKKR